ncbi:MAG: ribosome-associated translation inhibitor RaiA, partial [Arenicella sp.]
MKTEIRYVEAAQSKSLEEQLQTKLESLERKYDWILDALVFFKTEKHPNEENSVCEIKLSVAGPDIFASSNEINFNKAVNTCIDQVGIQLEKH